MQICKVSVRVRCSANHVVPNKEVTVPEILILQRVHGGKEAIQDIVPVKFDRTFNHDEERQRLRKLYERGSGNADDVNGLVSKLFGPFGKLPTTLKEIGLDAKAIAEQKRREAMEALAAADALDAQSQEGAEFADLTDDEREAIEALEARERDDDLGGTGSGIGETEVDITDPPPSSLGSVVENLM